MTSVAFTSIAIEFRSRESHSKAEVILRRVADEPTAEDGIVEIASSAIRISP